MARIGRKSKQWLSENFSERANFNPTERMLYGHDIAAIPGLFKPLIGRTDNGHHDNYRHNRHICIFLHFNLNILLSVTLEPY
ncbi:MAG: hypothetical protein KKD59_10375, partial [Acidobacteria bacterium]|nr:hypothetical protein [Acidobacteriota bacterium]